jgi:Tol biopolymer transport system component
VIFETMAANLVPLDTNKCRDVYVRDRWSKTIRRVSLSPSGGQVACAGSQTTTQGRISGDGKVVAWVSNQAGYVTGDTNGAADVFTRDLTTNSNRRVSVSSAGAQGTGTGAAAAIASGLSLSRDGDEVVFASGLNGLVSGDTPGLVDVFLRDRVAGTTVQVNRSTAGAPATGCASTDPRVSADGTKVAFTSCAPNLLNGIADATGGRAAVFVRDVPNVTTTLVSAGTDGLPRPGTESTRPAISADGTKVAFISNATGLVAGDTNEVRDVFVRDLVARVTTRASADAWGVQSSNPSTLAEGIGLTADGSTVAFGSRASTLVPGDTNNAADVFVRTTSYPAATAPAAPGLVTVARGPGGSVVKWLEPDANGAPVTGYTVTASPGGLTAEVAGDVTTATVDGLQHGIAYTFSVTATNDAGTGPSSPASNAIVHQALPDAPTGVYAMRGTGLPIVRWVPPNYQGAGQLTGFQVIANPGNIVTTVAPNLRETTVSNLVNGVSYKFTVKAVNAAGAGPASGPSGAVVSQTVPDVPGNVVAVRGDKAVTVRWTKPAFTGATALTGFVVTRTPGGVTTTVGPDATTATISGLTNGTQYAFTVYATNDNGRSRLSNITALVTPATVSNLTIGAAPIVGAAAGAPRVTLTGRLVDADGNGIAGQQVSLYGKAPSWKSWTLVGRVVTAADGTWSLAMTPAGPRNIYAAYAGSPGATAKTTGTVFVQ